MLLNRHKDRRQALVSKVAQPVVDKQPKAPIEDKKPVKKPTKK